MPFTNRFERYLSDRDNQSSTYSQRLAGMSLAQDDEQARARNLTLGVGLGLLAFGAYRGGALRGITSSLMEGLSSARGNRLRSILEGTREWARTSPDIPSVGLGKFKVFESGERSVNIMGIQVRLGRPGEALRSLERHISSAQDRISREALSPLGGRRSAFEDMSFSLARNRELLREYASDSIRYRRMAKELEGTDLYDSFIRMSRAKGATSSYFSNVSEESFRKKFSEHIGEQHTEEIWNVVSKYQRRGGRSDSDLFTFKGITGEGSQFTAEEQALVQRAAERGSRQLDQALIDALRVNEEHSARMMERSGIRQATVGDLHERGLIQREIERKGFDPFDMHSEIERLRKEHGREVIDSLSAGRGLYISQSGELVDLRHIRRAASSLLTEVGENFQIPLVNINLARMAHAHSFRDVANQSPFQLLSRASFHPGVGGSTLLQEDMIYAAGRVFPVLDPDRVVAEFGEVYTMSSMYGPFAKSLPKMAGHTNVPRQRPDGSVRGALYDIGKFLDIGMQEQPNIFQKVHSVFTKTSDPRWEGNWIRSLTEGRYESSAEAGKLIEDLAKFAGSRSRPLSRDTFDILRPDIERFYRDSFGIDSIDLTTDEGVLRTLERLATLDRSIGDSTLLTDRYGKSIRSEWQRYIQDPEEYLKRVRVYSNRMPFESMRKTELVSSIEDLRKLIQKETIARTMAHEGASRFSPTDIIESAYSSDMITRSGHRDAQDFLVSMQLDRYVGSVTEDALRQIADPQSAVHRQIVDFGRRNASIFQAGRFGQESVDDFFGADGSVVVRRFKKAPSGRDLVNYINLNEKERGRVREQLRGFINQFGAGRNNLEDVTTATLFPYYFLERLNDAVQFFGISLSNRSLGSFGSMLGSFLFKRALPVVGGAYYLGYLNWETENLTGINVRDEFLETAREGHLAYARFTDATGITEWAKRQSQLMPGFHEYTSELPFVGFLDPTRTEEELDAWYERGYEPVRRGRWWDLGNTPFIGDRIRSYQPNYVNRGQSDYKMTDSLYGDHDEYFANHWLPTPRYPFAPVRHFITDPYHYEEKHYYTRPYPMTGPIPVMSEMPLIGPALTPISNILKPPRKMHEDTIAEINRQEQERAMAPKILYAHSTASGQIRIEEWQGGVPSESGVMIVPGEGTFGGQQIVVGHPDASYEELSAINASILQSADAVKPLPEYQDQVAHVNYLIQMKAQGEKTPIQQYGTMVLVRSGVMPEFSASPQVPMDINSPEWAAGRLFYNFTEMGGFYGWSLTNVTGGDIFDDRPVIQDSSRMTSYERAFWDMNMGGLGGGLSEIFRRFIPHRRRQIQEWNPIPNQMPDWLPGDNYFIDFQTGDPYLKVEKGEMRLPGPGYEAIHDLHPDQFGEYGAFDRFRILADVAPYSDEFRFYSKVVSQMDLPPEMREEAREIRDRATESRQRRRFFNYKFLHASLREEQVTVTRVLGNNRFLTEEYPENPINLAGVKISNAATADPEMVDTIRRVVYPGARLTIGVTTDDVNLVNRDTYRTIDAVVYSRDININRMLIDEGLAEEDERDDSPAGIHARFTPSEIRQGSFWEWALHRDTMFHTKLMQVRSPLEDYTRRQVYGKDWQVWESPVSSYLVPTYESFINHNPLWGAGLGYFLGSRFGATQTGRRIGGIAGAAIIGIGATIRFTRERLTGETYIPQRRQKEREVEEYFDILEYLKYRGLFERYADLAARYEGADVRGYLEITEREGSFRSRDIKRLEEAKRHAKFAGDEEEVSRLNAEINSLRNQRSIEILGPYSARALAYRQAYRSTMYGADPYGSWQDIMRALPKKERDYFVEFANASEHERDEILEVVPSYVRRFLQARWGMEVDERPNLEEYFQEHYLPTSDWEGWDESKNLQDVKIRVVKNEALDTSEFDIWPEDERRAEESNAPTWNINDPNIRASQIRKQIEAILAGQGLGSISVSVLPASARGIFIDMDLLMDRRQEIINYMNNNMGYIVGG